MEFIPSYRDVVFKIEKGARGFDPSGGVGVVE